MGTKIEEHELIAYLYGELSAEEQRRIAAAIAADADLKKEVEELQQLRGVMGKLSDQEVEAPTFIVDDTVASKVNRVKILWWVPAVAAACALLIISGYATGFYFSGTTEGISIGFGRQEQQNTVSKEEVRTIMQEVLAAYNQDRDEKLAMLESKLTTRLEKDSEVNRQALISYMKTHTEESRVLMKQYVVQASQQNQKMIADYFKVSTEQQEQYLQTVLTDFTQYYNNQRKEDLQTIRTGLMDFKKSNDIKQYETEVVLANLIDMVNTQNK